MRIVERSPNQRELTSLFFPQEPRRIIPDEVSEEIILQHTVQPPTASFVERIFRSATVGAAASTTVEGPVVPDGVYWWIQATSLFHNDPTSRALWINMGSAALGFTELHRSIVQAENLPFALQRTFLLPPGLRLRGRAAVLDPTFVLTLNFIYVEYLLAENHPGI